MPYIPKVDRTPVNTRHRGPDKAGEFNYLVTKLIIKYIERNGLSYQTINDVVGGLNLASHEFKRRVVDPYEDKKIAENEDVYPAELTGS